MRTADEQRRRRVGRAGSVRREAIMEDETGEESEDERGRRTEREDASPVLCVATPGYCCVPL